MTGGAAEPRRIFVTGATGYIGGSVAVALVTRGHHVRGLTRDASAGAALEQLGIEPVLGSLEDSELLAAEAAAADTVVNAADSDHRGSVDTLVAALAETGKGLIHTSGSSVVGTASAGEGSRDVWDESILAPGSGWEPHPFKADRVAIDRSIVAAGDRGVRGVVLCNSLIYGLGRGIKRDSVQIPALTSTAIRRRVACHVGPGENRWSTVHIADMADLYRRVVEDGTARGFYFVESGEVAYSELTAAIADRLGLAEPRGLSIDEATKEWGYKTAAFSLGSSSRVRGRRARAELGWRPDMPDVLTWIRDC